MKNYYADKIFMEASQSLKSLVVAAIRKINISMPSNTRFLYENNVEVLERALQMFSGWLKVS